ncbi:3-ketoacyl-ACP reductase [Paenibacillus mucilaginosus]|uniref:Short-chain dehydrogenase/reductase SDR n=3 Tax=Paenibacillus mucilaginosus TaxID=61624 RepID=H6NGR9_9BACL|nr:3-ketoacyl-ACP reductase [Paenibacillus mucilaginosus]AEI46372.1 short-chain dehydrogenase/reductase SDR [Paenibacillus mucilaginosus KNP414]AFC33972.1 short-chain dehydrogenase/reductase SDR [Paenibacillus mucilaginosus 3016]AFH66301.1 3-ketoacyl-ACP reductase [Paenibacillus mucilaginosus K02]MCG7213515.1 3-ketoacyl-ACP reductase [Paenibacillus mucilaginosus]WDM27669.1 3-ketoacyl-ACP reductase [Paenibacillus mucilaginosus]
MELKNKTAIITGAGKGIGKAAAIALAKEGVHLGLIARSTGDLEALKSELQGTYGINVFYASADISNRSEVEAAVQGLIGQLGSLDILINNAGIASFGKVAEMDPEQWEQIIRTNLLGTYYVTRAALPTLLEQQSGSIINVASTAGERGFATGSAYCASKFAVMGFTESLFQEVRKSNIRVTALTPSTVNTELASNAGLPIGDEDRMMQPEDVADLILAALKLPARVFVKAAGIWTTNPQ